MKRTDRPTLLGRDLVSEALAGLLTRPGRTALTVLGTVLGIAAFVATLGLTSTAGNAIVSQFDELAARWVSVTNRQLPDSDEVGGPSKLPWDSEDRLVRLNGVVAAGTISSVSVNDLSRSIPMVDPLGRSELSIDVYAASPGLLDAVQADIPTGRAFDEGHSMRADPVAILGKGAAQRLGIGRLQQQPVIFVGDTVLAVIGIIESVSEQPALLNAIVVPDETARRLFELQAPEQALIFVEVGAAELVGGQAAVALSPERPELLEVSVPREPSRVREAVQAEVNALFFLLGLVVLVVGGISIANTILVAVIERTPEIGIRLAMGAAKRHIVGQFLTESAALGVVGGVVGSSIGVLCIVAVSAIQQWSPVLDAWVPAAAVGLGCGVGVLAGLYPAWRAGSLEPAEAVRVRQ